MNNMKQINLTTKQVFYIAKALKFRYNIPIIKTINKVNFNEFYSNLNKNVDCDKETIKSVLKMIKILKGDLSTLVKEGEKIILDELRFKSLNWSQIISNLKTTFKATNKKLGKLTACSHKNIGAWERGTRKPDYNNCKLLLSFMNKNKLNPEHLSKLSCKKHTYQSRYLNLKPLNLNQQLSEFIGILNGDGTITRGGQIGVTGNSIEDFMHHKFRVKCLCKELFDKNINLKIANSVVKSFFTSLYITKQLERIGLIIGRKNNLRVPKKIIKNKTFIKPYLRGLFDTDGTICRRNENNARIDYGSFKGEALTKDIFIVLKKLGYNPQFTCYDGRSRAEIINDIEVIKFFKEIGSCNYSKIARFIYWRFNKIIPSYDYISFGEKLKEQKIDIEKINIPFIWDIKYIRSLNSRLKNILLPILKEDQTKLKLCKIRNKIDWKRTIFLLKKGFGLSRLTKEFDTNYKVIWQWQKGIRIPSLANFVLIYNFCKKKDIKLF